MNHPPPGLEVVDKNAQFRMYSPSIMQNQANGMPMRHFGNNNSMPIHPNQQMHHAGYMSQNYIPKPKMSFGLNAKSKAFKPKYMNRWNSAAVDEFESKSRFGESQTKSVEGILWIVTIV